MVKTEETIGETTIDLMSHSTKIIVDFDRVINNTELKWRHESNGGIELTLDEIAEQIKTDTIYVWIELALRGEIYLYNNNGDKKWYLHGTTKGYA